MKKLLILLALCSCSGKDVEIIDDVLEGEVGVVEDVIADEAGVAKRPQVTVTPPHP